jgi:hypothetical protein
MQTVAVAVALVVGVVTQEQAVQVQQIKAMQVVLQSTMEADTIGAVGAAEQEL